MNRREFVRNGLFAAVAAAGFPGAFAAALAKHMDNLKGTAALSDLENELLKAVLAKVDEVNPIDPATGRRKYLSFGFVTDLHKCKRVPGDDAKTNPKKDYWYGSAGVLTADDPSLRLLGAVAGPAGLDAVVNGGDISTAPTAVPLTEPEYIDEIANVKALFNTYLPKGVPLFTVDGNHERRYKHMQISDATWRQVQEMFNTPAKELKEIDVVYHRDLPYAHVGRDELGPYVGNAFHLDFRRLYKTKGYNLRLVCLSEYDRSPGAFTGLRAYDATSFYDPEKKSLYDPEKTPENTIVGLTGHDADRSAAGITCNGYLNAGERFGNSTQHVQFAWNLKSHRGRGFFGMVAGHAHQSLVKPLDANNPASASIVQVTRCYSNNLPSNPRQDEQGKKAAYRFSLFVFDTDRNLMHEVRLAGADPVVSDTNIATPAAPAAKA